MMPANVAAKNAANPVAVPISRLANQPRSPTGTPNSVPGPPARPETAFLESLSVCTALRISWDHNLDHKR